MELLKFIDLLVIVSTIVVNVWCFYDCCREEALNNEELYEEDNYVRPKRQWMVSHEKRLARELQLNEQSVMPVYQSRFRSIN